MLCVLAPSAVSELRGEAMLFSVVLTWREPVPLNGILNRYTIRYSVNGSSEITNSTRDTTFSITDLNPNTVVSNIRVIAATGAGDGPPQMLSNIITLDKPCECYVINLTLTHKIILLILLLLLVVCLSTNGQ